MAANTDPTNPGPPDRLEASVLAQRYGYALNVLKGNDELWGLFQRAFNGKKGQWTEERFTAAVKNSDWYKTTADYARLAWVAEQTGGADWASQMEEAKTRVQETAAQWGASLTEEQKGELARRYIYEGWGQQDRQRLFTQALSDYVQGTGPTEAMQGAAGTLQAELRSTAYRNGVTLDDSFFESAARSVMQGLSTPQDWDRQVREQAASNWPTWSDKIMAGVDARDLASGYINTMARTYELDPNSIDLNDSRLRAAMTGVDEKGNPRPLGLWEFEQSLRAKPEWQNTKQAQDTVTGIGLGILKRMGFVG